MKKILTPLWAVLLIALSMGFWGCGDDDPVDPPAENCDITVTSPVAGDNYRPGDEDHNTMNIRWTSTGDADLVKIELLKAGALVDVIHPSLPNSGFYRWTASNMGADNGSDFAIRVSANGETDCLDVSGLFTMTNTAGCTLDFTNEFPDTLFAGDVFGLTWSSANTTGNVDIQLRRQDQSLGLIATGIDDDGSYDWTVDSLHNGSDGYYFLRIIDSDLDYCYADSVTFAMVDEDICYIDISNPPAGTVWAEGSSQNIMLTGAPEISTVNLRLYTGNVFVGYINHPSTPISIDDFPYTWDVNDFDNTQGTSMYRVQAVNSDDQYCVGQTGFFTIVPQ